MSPLGLLQMPIVYERVPYRKGEIFKHFIQFVRWPIRVAAMHYLSRQIHFVPWRKTVCVEESDFVAEQKEFALRWPLWATINLSILSVSIITLLTCNFILLIDVSNISRGLFTSFLCAFGKINMSCRTINFLFRILPFLITKLWYSLNDIKLRGFDFISTGTQKWK